MITDTGSALGIDVGTSPSRRTSAACRLDWTADEITWTIERFRSTEKETIRRVAGAGPIACVAIDGPLRRGFDLIGRYRVAERMLTRKLQPLIGKPGQSSSPVGKDLNQHANACAEVARSLGTLAPARHQVAIDDLAVVEAFPTAFLGLMLGEPGALATTRNSRSDVFYEALVGAGHLQRLLALLIPARHLAKGLDTVTQHDDRAALICALTALCVAAGDYTAVGDNDGWIILPPRSMVRDWAWELLEANVEAVGELTFEQQATAATPRMRQ